MRYKLTTLILLAAIFTGCTGHIEGVVFLDEDTNNSRGDKEYGVEKVLYSVSKDTDDNVIANGISDSGGTYRLSIPGPGYYCVNLKKTAGSYLDSSTEPMIADSKATSAMKSIISKDTTSSSTTTTSTTDDQDTSGGTTTTTTTQTKETRPDSTTALKACANCSGYTCKLRLDVPIARDYAASAMLAAPEDLSGKPGETVSGKINVPCSCKLLDYALPNFVEKTKTTTMKYDADIAKPYDITQDPICKVGIDYTLENDVTADESGTIAFKAICPNDATISLPSQKIKVVVTDGSVLITQKITDTAGKAVITIKADDELILKTKVINDNYTNYESAKLSIQLPSGSRFVSASPSTCSGTIEKVDCIFDIDKRSEKEFSINFRMKEIIEVETKFTITSKLKLPGAATTIDESILFTVTPPAN